MSETYTIAEATRKLRELGHEVWPETVRRLLKWYSLERGVTPAHYRIPNSQSPSRRVHGPWGYIYALPKDFIDWAHNYLTELGR